MTSTLLDPETPFLALDITRVDQNIARLKAHLKELGDVPLRQHVKTAKCTDVASRAVNGDTGPITVSTLAEADYFADAGWTDILYAVGLAPAKLPHARRLVDRGVDLTVLLDSMAQAEALASFCQKQDVSIPALIEIDCDGHRGGIHADDPLLVEIGRVLNGAGLLGGVLDHAGESYFTTGEGQVAAAENERVAAADAADRLRGARLPCPIVSIGSTPTAHATRNLEGVTEVRAGNFVFFDLVMAGIGVCRFEDIAMSVVVTVIGHKPEKGWIFTDGGWMAVSRDRGTSDQTVDQGYGLVTALDGKPIPDLLMSGASQEHGVLSMRPGTGRPLPDLPIGTRLRIVPNHACATAAQHAAYQVTGGEAINGAPRIIATWNRHNGW